MMSLGKLKLIVTGLLMAVGLAIGAGVLAQQASEGRPPGIRPEAAAQPPPGQSPDAGADRRWVKTLANGATIEVIGVSPHPSGPDTWWAPDGSPLAQPPCDPSPTRMSSDRDVVYRAVVARQTRLPPDANHGWSIRPVGGSSSQGPATRNGKIVPGLSVKVMEFPKGLATCMVEFSVAAGPWQTVTSTDGRTTKAGASRGGPSYIFGQAIATKGGTVLAVTHNVKEEAVRLVAVDRDGKEHPPADGSGGSAGVNGYSQVVAEFDISPEEIREVRLQTRPYEHVEIPDIALKPAGDK